MKRIPLSVAVIAKLTIIFGLFYLILLPLAILLVLIILPMGPVEFNYKNIFLSYLFALNSIIGARKMLKGKNWGRQLIIATIAILFIASLFRIPFLLTKFSLIYFESLIFNYFLSGLIIYFLTRPNADDFFGAKLLEFR